MRKLKQVLLTCVLGIVVFALSGCGSTTIDLNKYVTIEAGGYDSIGTLNCTFDYEAFEKDYDGKIKANVKSSDGGTAAEIALALGFGAEVVDVFLDCCVNYQIDKSSELSNGDVVNLKWDCEDEDAKKFFNVQLKYSDIQYTVKELTEVGTFDPFEYVSVEFSGFSSDASATITPNNDKPEMQYIIFSADKSSQLANGDKITLTAGIQGSVDGFVEQFSTIPQPLEKEFIVEGLPEYISSAADIDTDTMNALKQLTENAYMDVYNSDRYQWGGRDERDELKSLSYYGNYFLKRNEKESLFGGYKEGNILYLIYKADVMVYAGFSDEGVPATYYYVSRCSDFVTDDNGSCSVDIDNYKIVDSILHVQTGSWIEPEFIGFATLEDLYEKCIQPVQDYYTCEDNVSN